MAAAAGRKPPRRQRPCRGEDGKFTQRLTREGTEIDPGPAGGEAGIGEGTSVAALTQPPAAPRRPQRRLLAAVEIVPADPAAPAAAGRCRRRCRPRRPPAPAAAAAAAAPATAPAARRRCRAGGSRGRRSARRRSSTRSAPVSAEGSAEPGSIVWSLVQESPGGNLPPEPAIRAEATIPGKDVQLRMTIKRNADQTLPASHIIEMIFLTPEGFEGGGIDNILRVAMKGSEQEAGNPLIGIPAKIADGFFLVALNDTKAEIDANMTLLRRQSWIDVPVVYKIRPPRAVHHGKGHSRRQGLRRGAEGLAGRQRGGELETASETLEQHVERAGDLVAMPGQVEAAVAQLGDRHGSDQVRRHDHLACRRSRRPD